MSITFSKIAEEVPTHTSVVWREQTVPSPSVYLSLLLAHLESEQSTNYQNPQKSRSSLLVTLHSALACLSYLWHQRLVIPQAVLVPSSHPHHTDTAGDEHRLGTSNFDVSNQQNDTFQSQDDLKISQLASNISPTATHLITDPKSVPYVCPQRVTQSFKSPLALLRQYMVGRFDNSAQIAREKASGGQRTAYAMHINDVIDDRLEGGPQEGVIHILEETYKYAPGDRNPQIKPLILRFEEIDGAIALTSMKAPDYIDKTALRNDNPCLWFGKSELNVSPSFPERQIYQFDHTRKEFMLDVSVRISETVRFHLWETLASDRLVVSEKLWIGEKLKTGCYEEPFIYERVCS